MAVIFISIHIHYLKPFSKRFNKGQQASQQIHIPYSKQAFLPFHSHLNKNITYIYIKWFFDYMYISIYLKCIQCARLVNFIDSDLGWNLEWKLNKPPKRGLSCKSHSLFFQNTLDIKFVLI